MGLIVLCWAYETRLEEKGGVGYSVQNNTEDAGIWKRHGNEKIPNYAKGMAVYYICGRGMIETPSQELQEKLGAEDGIFINQQPEGFHLTNGKTPEQVTDDFLDEMNGEPD